MEIDWAYYKTAVARAGMVDEFEKKVRSNKNSPDRYLASTAVSRGPIIVHLALDARYKFDQNVDIIQI